MAHLPVRPGHLRQRRALVPCSCPPGSRPLLFRSDRRGGGLSSPSLDGGLEEFRGVCLTRASRSAIRFPRARKLGPALLQGAQRVRQFPAQRRHERGQHLIRRRFLITGHTRTLRATNRRRLRFPPHRRARLRRRRTGLPSPARDQACSAIASPVTMARATGEE